MSKDLLKNAGLGLVALLVVCNTYSIHTTTKTTKRTGGFAPRVMAHVGSHKQQRPQLGSLHGRKNRGSKSSDGSKGHWKKEKEEGR